MKVQNILLEKITPYARNPRHNKEAVAGIAASIKEFGWTQPIVVDGNHVIVVGHTRYLAAIQLGMIEAPVLVAENLTPEQAQAYRILDNKLNEKSEWDAELLALELAELPDFDFSEFDVEFELEEATQESFDDSEDSAPEMKKEPFSKFGDVWKCGRHTVVCGDSCEVETPKSELVFTDPPYRMEVEGGSQQPIGRAAARLGEAIKHLCDFDPQSFLKSIPARFESDYLNIYIFCNKDLVPDYLNWAVKESASFNILFWKKPNAIPLGGQYRPDVEYLLHFRKSAVWNNGLSGANYSKCLEYGRESGVHPTIKPLALVVNAILISSNKEGTVIDPFLCSGTTLIACERTGRTCYGIEISPNYVDVILQRYFNETGDVPIRESDGASFPVEVKE